MGLFARLTATRRHARRLARPTHRRARLEPLEERRLLSVTFFDDGPDQDALGVGDESVGGVQPSLEAAIDFEDSLGAATEGQDWLREPVRIGVWTPEQIADVGNWVESQTWPDGMYLEGYLVKELIHMPLRLDPRGGYRTVLEISPITTLSADGAIAGLKQLDFVDFAKLESESHFRFTARLQELIDAMTTGGSDAPVYLPGEPSGEITPIEMRVGLWTEERIPDLGAWVEAQQWPEALGPVTADNVEQLVSIPLEFPPKDNPSQASRLGYRTIFRIDVFGDITALDQVDFIEFARLESQSVVQYGSRAQELIDAITTGAPAGPIYTLPIEAVSRLPIEMRVSIWTQERIPDLGEWVEAQEWPEALGPVHAEMVKELVHIPVWSEPRGGYLTIVRMPVFGDITALEGLQFVEHATLEAESVVQFGPRAQELIDATTRGAPTGPIYTLPIEAVSRLPIEMRVSVSTEERISDLGAWVKAREWPEALGPVTADNVEQLVSIPLQFPFRRSPQLCDGSGAGYRTIFRMTVFGDVTALDQVQFLEHAVLESESLIHFDSHVQELIDATTKGAPTGAIYVYGDMIADPVMRSTTYGPGSITPLLAESGDLINIGAFRADERFAGIDGNGSGTVVIDTGIDVDHPFFGPDNDEDGVADRIVYQYDFADDDSDASDVNGHGTHVTSIVASEDATYTGMVPAADIIALKVFRDAGPGDWTYLENALQWVVQNAVTYNIASVNMSLGDGGNYQTPQTLYDIYDEIGDLAAMGVMVVSASGNSFYTYDSTQGVGYPSADANSLSVGAVYDDDVGRVDYADGAIAYTTAADRITAFSQRDEQLTTVMAPGDLITAAAIGGGTADKRGTSMAAPHISGIALLAQQLAVQELGQPLTQEQFADLLQDTGATVNDGDDEDDNVDNTDLDFARVDMFALGEGILDLLWEFDAGEEAGDETPDTFVLTRVEDSIQVEINAQQPTLIPLEDVVRITLTGSTDQDTFTVNSLGADFAGNVVINAAGEGDIVRLYDSPGSDTLTAYPGSATFEMESGYRITTYDHGSLYAYSQNGGEDWALLHDMEGSSDTFKAWPTLAKVYGDGFHSQANSFRWVLAYSDDQTAEDTAVLYDLEGSDDTFEAWPTDAKLYADGFSNRAKSFRWVIAESDDQIADDTAVLYDDPAGDDTFNASPTDARLYGNGFFNRVKSFSQVLAYSGVDHGNDIALLYDDPAGNDTFKAWPTLAKLYSAGFLNQAKSFAQVHAYSGVNHGADIASLYDDPTGDDTFRAWPTEAKLYGNGFYNRAKSFAQVHAFSGPDHGQDVAQLYDDDSGNDTFKAWPTEARLYGNGFYNRAKSFRTVYGYFEQGSGGTDVAYLYDSTGDDYLLARDGDPSGEDWVLLRDEADAVYAIWAAGLDEIWADSGTGDDTADEGDNLDFQLHLTGVWEN